jgi:hypothetical protein
MPKKQFPYNQKGRLGTYPWLWAWDVPTSKGTGTPYVVSVRDVVAPHALVSSYVGREEEIPAWTTITKSCFFS